MTDTKKLGNIIDDMGLKKSWIAEKLGISRQNFSQKMNGKREFTKQDISRIKDILELSDSDVIDIFLCSRYT